MDLVRIQEDRFNLQALIDELLAGDAESGAVVSFLGVTRDRNQGDAVSDLWLEHYPGMTERAIADMVTQARTRFSIHRVAVVHRVGHFLPKDEIVAVVVSSAHRGEAFQACEFLMDYLKIHAPFWKKEQTPEGARWVDARVTDDQAAAKWGISPQA